MVVVLAPPGLLSAVKLGSGLAQAIPLGAVTPAGCAASTAAYSASSQLVEECCAFRSSAGSSGSGRGALVVIARGGTRAPPRSGTKAAASRWLEYVVTKPKLRKRRRGGRGDDSGDDSGDDGSGFGGSGGNWGNGGHGDWSSYSGGDAFGQWAQYELGWLWPLIVAASVLHSLGYIMTSTDDMRRSRIRSCSMASR